MRPCTIQICCPLCGSHDIDTRLATRDYSITQEAFDLVDCRNCGVRFTQPLPNPGEVGRYYQSEDYISHSDTRKGLINQLYHWARQWMLGRKRRLLAHLHPQGRRVLDVGCGTGYFLHHLQQHGYAVLGVEVDAAARQFAQQQFGLAVLEPAAWLAAPAAETQFDLITLWHVLEHVHEPRQYLDRLQQQLAPGGMLLIAVPNYTSYDAQYYGATWAAYDVPRHLWHFSPPAMKRLIAEHGFTLVGRRQLPLDPFYVSLLSEKYRHSGTMGMLRAGAVGLLSAVVAGLRPQRASSLVYVLQKA